MLFSFQEELDAFLSIESIERSKKNSNIIIYYFCSLLRFTDPYLCQNIYDRLLLG